MDLTLITQVSLLSGSAVSLVTEILKSDAIPVPVQNHKRLTALLLSVGASAAAVWDYDKVNIVNFDWKTLGLLSVMTLLVAATTYNQVIKGA